MRKNMGSFGFSIEKKIPGALGRAGHIHTVHGSIATPAFIPVGTKATVKALTSRDVRELGAQAVLANTYHLYLAPGHERIAKAGGLHAFMDWQGPMFTDSGGFQAFSLGAAFAPGEGGQSSMKRAKKVQTGAAAASPDPISDESATRLAKITEDGVVFKSVLDGSEHFFTPERSMEIQAALGADIIFAFDECTSPDASLAYQREAMERTHRWAQRSLDAHDRKQALYGVVQGGRHMELRQESARTLATMPFDGFGIGGSFDKEDMHTAVHWVNEILPEDKPRHLLGIGEPGDMIRAVEEGVDTFDCVAPTRMARNGNVMVPPTVAKAAGAQHNSRLNLFNAQFVDDFGSIDPDCDCYTCTHHTRAYLAHLFRAHEMLAATLASIHNLRFTVRLVEEMRTAILAGTWQGFKEKWALLLA